MKYLTLTIQLTLFTVAWLLNAIKSFGQTTLEE